MNQLFIRNFAIIAHIDHGKSTLADRLMEATGTVSKRDMQEQLLDSNPIERERGITIKLAPVRMAWTASKYILNLIDTPGHVDFTYEVSRSLAACEGALLVVDASQGVQAQTLANLHLARMHNLKVIPLINKIDLPNARIEETKAELEEIGFSKDEMLLISAKTGKGIEEVLEAIIDRIPPPQGDPEAPTRALVFSSQYDPHKGVVVFVRVVDGNIGAEVVNENFGPSSSGSATSPLSDKQIESREAGQNFIHSPRHHQGIPTIRFLQSGSEVTPIEIGYFSPKMIASDGLLCGEVGYIATGLKDVRMAKVGDTITTMLNDKCQMPNERQKFSIGNLALDVVPLPGYKEPKPMVFVGLFPIEQDEFTKSRVAMEKLRLSDSAFSFRPISSQALGNGFHCGFLGLLHAEIVQERLSREFGLSLLATSPSVEYRVRLKAGVNPGKAGLSKNATPDLSARRSFSEGGIQDPSHDSESQPDFSTLPGMTGNTVFSIQSPSEFPDPTYLEEAEEPMMQVRVYAPKRYVGPIMQLAQEKRGDYIDLVYHADQAEFTYLIPLSDMIVDFFDALKSVTEGYASLDYEFFEYKKADIIKVDILANHEKVDALSFLVVRDQARSRGKDIVEKLAEVLPRQQFAIPVQAAIGGEIIARADIKPFRKDVIAKLYGGDRTRKDKLLKKQKKGKERMKKIGSVEIPQTAFFDVLRKH